MLSQSQGRIHIGTPFHQTCAVRDGSPSWSPDGSQIAFSRSGDVYTIASTGGTPANITNSSAFDRDPHWGMSLSTPTPTPTPSPTPAPQMCEVINVNSAVKLRVQPSLDEENWLIEVPDTYVYTSDTVVSGASLPNRPWLWSGGSVPSSVTISSIQAIAYVGAIDWVDPDVDWIQVQMTTGIGNLKGYMERTDVNGNAKLSLAPCNLGALPIPTPDPLPTATLDAFAGVSPILSVFDGLQSPATMGSFGLYLGTNPSQPGATLDIVPRNMELCIDTTGTNQLGLCDTATEPPVYSPVNGCAIDTGTSDNTVEINIDLYIRDSTCTSGQASGDLQVVITHIVIDSSIPTTNRVPVTAGDPLGYLCDAATALSVCGVATSATPTHVAFQLRTLLFPGPSIQEINDVIPFLGISEPYCVYDEWEYSPGSPAPQNAPVHGCPF